MIRKLLALFALAIGFAVVKAPAALLGGLLGHFSGTGLFWVLVVAIVLARAVYFEPGNFSFERAMAWIQGLMAVFQGSSV